MKIENFEELRNDLSKVVDAFVVDKGDIDEEIQEDFSELLNVGKEEEVIINAIGVLSESLGTSDRDKAMKAMIQLRVAMMNIENAYSNCAESLEKLMISVRDGK